MAHAQHTPNSSISSTASYGTSAWSRGHSSKSSTSSISITSSPIQARDSFDTYGATNRLEDVREEEDFPSRQICSCKSNYMWAQAQNTNTMLVVDDYRCGASSNFLDRPQDVAPSYALADQGAWSTASGQHHSKRQRSLDGPRHSVTQGFTSRFGSLSRRWRNRSTTGPPLSIITNTTPIASPRSSLDVAVNYHSRSASITSNNNNNNDIYSPASMHSFVDEPIPESEAVPIYFDRRSQCQEEPEEDEGQATTPLLPPTMLGLKKKDSPIQSPLQSPSIAPTNYVANHRSSMDRQTFSYLPSPPLSTRPSLASMPRCRVNAAAGDVPILQQLSERLDPWTIKLGHADFSIHPEPYQPNIIDLDNYKEFRDNWSQARKQYAQHLARTIEHYGDTSKVYRLTEEKWTSIDQEWKKYNDQLSIALSPQLARLSDDPTIPDSPISLLDKPVSRIVVPTLDKGGKFPEIGDTDIVGPLAIGVAKVPELQRGAVTPPTSPKKRNFFKSIGGVFKSH